MNGLGRISVAGLAGALWVMVAGCSLEAPKAPNWDTTLNVPVADHTYSVSELVADDENFRAGADSLLSFHFEQTLDTTRIGDYLTLPDIHQSVVLGLDAFQIPSVPVMADRFLWSQLTAEAISLDGTVAAVSPFVFNYVESAIHNSEDLLYAVLTSGIARLHIYNRLNVDLENVILSLRNTATGGVVVSSPLVVRIMAQDSAIVEVNMKGLSVPREGRWLMSGNSPGSRGRQVPVNRNLPVDVVAELRDFVIAAAEARIPSMTLQRTDTLWIEDSGGNAIDAATFQSGRMLLRLQNHSPFASPDLTLQFPQIQIPETHKVLELHLVLKPAAVTQSEVDLSGMVADLPLPPVGSPQAIQVAVKASTDDMRSSFVELGAATDLEISVDLEEMRITQFSGRLAAREVRLDSTVRALDISGEWGDLDGVTLQDARLQVEVFSTINLPLRFRGALYGFSNGRQGTPFALDIAVPAATGSAGQLYKAPAYTAQNSTIVAFINQQPDMIAAAGVAQIGDSLSYGSVRREDVVSARFTLDLPFNLSWNARMIDGEVSSLQITPPGAEGDAVEEKDGEVVLSGESMERVRSAELELVLENRMPVAGEVTFYFATDSSRIFSRPDLMLGPVALAAAATDGSGKATTASISSSRLTVAKGDMALFQNSNAANKILYFSHRIAIKGSGGRGARVYLPDYVRVQALLRLTVNVGS
jgi:hypothetical protein